MNSAGLIFERRIIAVPNFLPNSTFELLCSCADRQVESERVHIPGHKRGATISYHDLQSCAPELVTFYHSPEFQRWCSFVIGERVQPTPLNDLSSCSLLIYSEPDDHIGWHRDHNFYNGRHFTALLSLINTNADGDGLSSAQLTIRDGNQEEVIPTAPNTLVLFEGAHILHRVTPLLAGERRVILSMTFCTDPSSTALRNFERRLKDIAYFGLRALWD